MFHGKLTALCRRHDDDNNYTEKWENTKSTPRNFSRNLGHRDGVKWTEKIARACVFICVFECVCMCMRFPSKRRGEKSKYSSTSEPRRVIHRHCTRFQFRGDDDIINAYYVPPHRHRLVTSFCTYLLYVIVW